MLLTWKFPSLVNVLFLYAPLSSHFEIEIAGTWTRCSSKNLNVCVGPTKMDKSQKLNVGLCNSN